MLRLLEIAAAVVAIISPWGAGWYWLGRFQQKVEDRFEVHDHRIGTLERWREQKGVAA